MLHGVFPKQGVYVVILLTRRCRHGSQAERQTGLIMLDSFSLKHNVYSTWVSDTQPDVGLNTGVLCSTKSCCRAKRKCRAVPLLVLNSPLDTLLAFVPVLLQNSGSLLCSCYQRHRVATCPVGPPLLPHPHPHPNPRSSTTMLTTINTITVCSRWHVAMHNVPGTIHVAACWGM